MTLWSFNTLLSVVPMNELYCDFYFEVLCNDVVCVEIGEVMSKQDG